MGDIELTYASKAESYFDSVRKEILPFLPDNVDRVLDIGCGSGVTAAYLKSSGKCNWAGGVELFPNAVEKARERLDAVYEINIEKMNLPIDENSIDIIFCLDVLEHLINPWNIVSYLTTLVKPGGIIVASIPNVRHFRVVLPLLFQGKWDYTDSGLLDKTHLRFFEKNSAKQLMEYSGLTVDKIESTGLEKGSISRIVNNVTLSMFKPFFEAQYILRAKKQI